MAKILFKTFSDLKEHVGTAQPLTLATFQSSALQAAEKFIIPAIGRETYDFIADAFHGENPLTQAQEDLLPYIQRPLAFYTMLEASPTLTLQIGEAGVMEANSEHVVPVRQWVLKDAQESWLSAGDLYTDLLLEFLEKNKDDYEVWVISDSFTESKSLTIPSTKVFDSLIRINNSRRTYLALRPFIERAEDFYLPEVMGAAFFLEFKETILEEPMTPDTKDLLKRVRAFVVYTALLEAIPELNIQISGSGFKVLSTSDGIAQKMLASDTAISALQSKYKFSSDYYRQTLFSFLENNQETYPGYVSPSVSGSKSVKALPDNSNTSAKSFLF
jgi:hypothetical protein